MALCLLSDVKTKLGIAQNDTSQDDRLNLLIKSVSAKIESYIGYKLGRGTYSEELHNVNNTQLIQLNHWPLVSVSSVTVNEGAIDDYKIIPEYARWGRLYRGDGWTGAFYTRGFTHDIVSGAWDIKVSYTAGYLLPGDTGYQEGADGSLPYDITIACLDSVALEYNAENNGSIGLKAHSEGGISDTYGNASEEIAGGLTASVKAALGKYIFYGVA